MPRAPGSSILQAVRLIYGAMFILTSACGLGAYAFWPGAIAWIFLALGALALAGGVAFTQLLARLRMILWLLPYLDRLRAKGEPRANAPDGKAGRGPDVRRGPVGRDRDRD
ncbi:MAG: hypothetical protein BGO49_11085 [Planctomycetales bacterium 71-10]|nr:MAG: hypothetical protein BGO49_11085 [Planctomycetales bacterium 71-10]